MSINIAELHKNKAKHIAMKKLSEKRCDSMIMPNIKGAYSVDKSATSTATTEDKVCCATVKVYANTYYWLDSHGDVHVKGTFTKSIKENINNIFHLDNHIASFGTQAGEVQNVEEVSVKWSDLGINKTGSTICVLGTSEVNDEINEAVLNAYVNKKVYNHSVGMVYVNLQLAIKERNKEYAEENKAWDDVYPLLGNQDTADEEGYFWIVKEAKLKEFSSLLWDGSNSVTPTQSIIVEPSEDTQTINTEPGKSTQETKTSFDMMKTILQTF